MKTITTFGVICALAPSHSKTGKKESHKVAKKGKELGVKMENAGHDIVVAGKKAGHAIAEEAKEFSATMSEAGHDVYVAGKKAGHEIVEQVKEAEEKTEKFFRKEQSAK
jgi:hypothetical protein